ncbi:50S ribosomal protein L27 [Elusimicrobiota bacterium]
MARKRSTGCASYKRGSGGQRLGVKVYGGAQVKTGGIIVRQKGTQFHPGMNVAKAKNDCLFALADGLVSFGHGRGGRRIVSVRPNPA